MSIVPATWDDGWKQEGKKRTKEEREYEIENMETHMGPRKLAAGPHAIPYGVIPHNCSQIISKTGFAEGMEI